MCGIDWETIENHHVIVQNFNAQTSLIFHNFGVRWGRRDLCEKSIICSIDVHFFDKWLQ